MDHINKCKVNFPLINKSTPGKSIYLTLKIPFFVVYCTIEKERRGYHDMSPTESERVFLAKQLFIYGSVYWSECHNKTLK